MALPSLHSQSSFRTFLSESLSSLSKAILQHHSILQCHGHSTVSWTPYSVIGTIQCHRHPKMSWTLYSVMNITRKYHGHPTVSQTFYLVTGTLQCHGYSTLLAFIIAYCEFSERLLVFFIYNCFSLWFLFSQKLSLAKLKFWFCSSWKHCTFRHPYIDDLKHLLLSSSTVFRKYTPDFASYFVC